MEKFEHLDALNEQLQRYIAWEPADDARLAAAAPLVESKFPALVDDFYRELQCHSELRSLVSGPEQTTRLKQQLLLWLARLFQGNFDSQYMQSQSQIGLRHVAIGVRQVYVVAAMARLRGGLAEALTQSWQGVPQELSLALISLNKAIDLHLAIIEDAYHQEQLSRQQRVERLAALGQIAGGIAHELRNPLNGIQTSTYYLERTADKPDHKWPEHLRRIKRQIGKANDVITALSSFAKLPIPRQSQVDLAELVDSVVEDEQLPPEIEVRSRIPDDFPSVQVDPQQLSIVIANLLRNAADAMPAGGLVEINAVQRENEIQLTVADEGQGIPRDAWEKVMEPLYSTKRQGVGLGLAISRSIVENHGGRLEVASNAGRGSRFSIALPKLPRLSQQANSRRESANR